MGNDKLQLAATAAVNALLTDVDITPDQFIDRAKILIATQQPKPTDNAAVVVNPGSDGYSWSADIFIHASRAQK